MDTILFSEVMFDAKTSGENPLHMRFIHDVCIPLFESWGYKVIILHSDKTYLDVFYHVITKPRKYPEHQGKRYGFCDSKMCCVRRDCKIKPIEQYLKGIPEPYVQHVGIASDEPARLRSLHKKKESVSLLEKYGYTEEKARRLCEDYGLLSPGYMFSHRGGCWMCPCSKPLESAYVKKNMPDAWNSFLALEKEPNLAFPHWNIYTKETLKERDILAEEILACNAI